jgi:hypothetical protein
MTPLLHAITIFLTSHLGDYEATVVQLGDFLRPTSADSKSGVTHHEVHKA